MKLLFSTILAALMAASVQAVTVAWTLQNSQHNIDDWTGQKAGATDSGRYLKVFAFFSTTDYVQGGTGENSLDHAAAYARENGTVAKYDVTTFGSDGKLSVFASGLNEPTANGDSSSVSAGFYYMVVFSGNITTGDYSYAIAKTDLIGIDTKDSNKVATNEYGVYNDLAGETPSVGDYVELNWMAGSTWSSPLQTPEPTVMALLALGVAGLALRRKNV